MLKMHFVRLHLGQNWFGFRWKTEEVTIKLKSALKYQNLQIGRSLLFKTARNTVLHLMVSQFKSMFWGSENTIVDFSKSWFIKKPNNLILYVHRAISLGGAFIAKQTFDENETWLGAGRNKILLKYFLKQVNSSPVSIMHSGLPFLSGQIVSYDDI